MERHSHGPAPKVRLLHVPVVVPLDGQLRSMRDTQQTGAIRENRMAEKRSTMRAGAVQELRERIAAGLRSGLGPTRISRTVGCSRTTVYRVRRLLEKPDGSLADGRRANPGRPTSFADTVWDQILGCRRIQTTMGSWALHRVVARSAQQRGLTVADIPSPSTIGRRVSREGLGRRAPAPSDYRHCRDAKPTQPGTFTIDAWGPWPVAEGELHVLTVQDRFTRLAAAIPLIVPTGTPGRGDLETASLAWARVIALAADCLLPPGNMPLRIYTHNAPGMVPQLGDLPRGARQALATGASLTYIPTGRSWPNGRLARFHRAMVQECFRVESPPTVEDAIEALREWLNYFNAMRSHSALGHRAPRDSAPWGHTLQEGWWEMEPVHGDMAVSGTVEAIRPVGMNGRVHLWEDEELRLPAAFAGHFVRVVFRVTGRPSVGWVLRHLRAGRNVVVARFAHQMDVQQPGAGKPLVTTCEPVGMSGAASSCDGIDH